VLQDKLAQVSAIVAERDRQLVEVNTAREERERIIAERDRQLVEVNAAREERERTLAERDRQLDQANAAQAGLEGERERSAGTIAGLAQRCGTLESEKTRLEAALAARERAIANLQSFRSWLAWPSRWLRQRLARSR
jgi:chromosome segregation ATPase